MAPLCLQDGASVRYLPKSAYLATPKHASAYISTATRMLSRAHSLYRASPQHRTSGTIDASAGAKAGNPLEGLWPLAEGTFASQLLAQLPKEDMPAMCLLYWRLLAALPDLAPACGSTAQAEEAKFVNALVSGTHIASETLSFDIKSFHSCTETCPQAGIHQHEQKWAFGLCGHACC